MHAVCFFSCNAESSAVFWGNVPNRHSFLFVQTAQEISVFICGILRSMGAFHAFDTIQKGAVSMLHPQSRNYLVLQKNPLCRFYSLNIATMFAYYYPRRSIEGSRRNRNRLTLKH